MAKTDATLEEEIESASADAVYPYWLGGPLPEDLTPWVERTQMTIDEQLAVCNAATAGPWYDQNGDDLSYLNMDYVTTGHAVDDEDSLGNVICVTLLQSGIQIGTDIAGMSEANAAFIAEARTHYPAALRAMAAIRETTYPVTSSVARAIEGIIDAFERGEYGE